MTSWGTSAKSDERFQKIVVSFFIFHLVSIAQDKEEPHVDEEMEFPASGQIRSVDNSCDRNLLSY